MHYEVPYAAVHSMRSHRVRITPGTGAEYGVPLGNIDWNLCQVLLGNDGTITKLPLGNEKRNVPPNVSEKATTKNRNVCKIS